jgi:lipopolysaccharide transport system ATP-binding protein
MDEIAIRVENLGKRYRIGQREQYKTFRDAITNAAYAPFRRLKRDRSSNNGKEYFWALKDVSFDISQGEVVGIIGRNGAGKSTLLKILSRITTPTEGKVELYGRVGSLLEVGTGFHPELTGRENIYLSGSILGMKKREIEDKFDDIVSFSEIETFLDTPVKRYSSGMYVRLAFAVASNLDPEILLVDEVLAVGDANFQKKCIGKMKDTAKGGRTVLFISHSMGAVNSLCTKTILLDRGVTRMIGNTPDVISEYIRMGAESSGEAFWDDNKDAPGDDAIRLRAVRIISEGEVTENVKIDRDVFIEMEFRNKKPGAYISSSIHLLDKTGYCVLASGNEKSTSVGDGEWSGQAYPMGIYRTRCKLPANFLNEGKYFINAFILTDVSIQHVGVYEVVSFSVYDTGEMRKEFMGNWIGAVRPKLEWNTQFLKKNELLGCD